MSGKGPVFRNPLRSVGVKRRVAIEQLIAQGLTPSEIADRLELDHATVHAVWDAMDEAAAEGT